MLRKIYKCRVNCRRVFEVQYSDDLHDVKLDVQYGNTDNCFRSKILCESLLSETEVEHLHKYVSDVDRLTYCISHGFLRNSLSKVLSLPNEKLEIDFFDKTKPLLKNRIADFNLSHSSNYFAYTIVNRMDGIVGVDIEKIIDLNDFDLIVRDHMHKAERLYILDNTLSKEEQLIRFYEIWTRKEAFLKMIGVGVVINLAEVNMVAEVNNVGIEIPEDVSIKGDQVFLYTLITDQFVLSVASNLSYIPGFIEVKSF